MTAIRTTLQNPALRWIATATIAAFALGLSARVLGTQATAPRLAAAATLSVRDADIPAAAAPRVRTRLVSIRIPARRAVAHHRRRHHHAAPKPARAVLTAAAPAVAAAPVATPSPVATVAPVATAAPPAPVTPAPVAVSTPSAPVTPAKPAPTPGPTFDSSG